MRDFVQRIVFSSTVMIVLGGVIAAVLLWFLAPLTGVTEPLGTGVGRAVAAALVPVALGVGGGLNRWRQRRENKGLTDAVAGSGSGSGSGAAAGSQEVQAVAGRLREALDTLRRSRLGQSAGRRWLYQLPWYVLIGPPGSGKTTALANSGLNFPLSDKFGRRGIGGIGGTRSCDWWFTDEAVLIDTAGRYTSQDSDPEADGAAWLGFLRLLKKHRRRQPLNGIIVAIGIGELLSSTPARMEHAQRIRQRVAEIYAELGTRLPVYMLFTKADLIAGFVEFFDDLGKEGRESVWGLTFDYGETEPEGGTLALYGPEFDYLVGRLNDRLFERLQQEADLERRALVFGFPQQVASLKELSQSFLQEVFLANAFDEPVLLRGVYFASSTQVGTPFDRVMQAMSSMFGVNREQAPEASANARSFFLTRMLRDVVLGEAALVDADPGLERRRRRIALGVWVAAACIVLGGSAGFAASFLANRALVDGVRTDTVAYMNQADKLSLERVSDSNLRPIVPLLDRLRGLPGGAAGQNPPGALVTSVGLSQSGKLSSAAVEAYHKSLGSLLLPRLILRLETQIADHLQDGEFLDEALKVYLMLGRQGPLDRDLITRWMMLDWKAEYPDEADAPLRRDLAVHLQAMLAGPFPDIVLNGDLIQRARETLQKVPLADRVYAAIAASAEARALPPWRVSDAAGPSASIAFTRRSGRPLTEGIPGLYTADGFRSVFLPALSTATQAALRDEWVVGQPVSTNPGDDAPLTLERQVTGLYLQDFAQLWDHLIGDLSIVRIGDMQAALRVLDVLASPSSPIRLLVASASNATELAPKPKPASGGGPDKEQDRLRALLGAPSTDPSSPAGIAANFSAQHFQELHSLTSVPPNSAPNAPLPIDSVVSDLANLYRTISNDADSGTPLQTGGAEASTADRIQASAAQLPQPVQGWVLGVSRTSATVSIGGARDRLLALWRQQAGPACQQTVKDHYPFQSSSTDDVSPNEFARLFAPGGSLDTFFNANLRTYVDTTSHPWRWRGTAGRDFGLGDAPLRQFEAASQIRDSYFAGAVLAVGFTVTPVSLEGSATGVSLVSDNQTVTYTRQSTSPVRFQWPGLAGSTGAKVSFAAQSGQPGGELDASGPWALFHLLDQARLQRLGASEFSLGFTAAGNQATFMLRPEDSTAPFTGTLVRGFHCPWN